MDNIKPLTGRTWGKVYFSAFAVIALTATSALSVRADDGRDYPRNGSMRANAGTAFTITPAFDANGNPIFPWSHEVRGIVQVSNLGNCTVHFNVNINPGTDCVGGHLYCLSGTMTITTLAGDELQTQVTGWGDPDPNDPSQPANMIVGHYDVVITGGTGKLLGAKGGGGINVAGQFCGANCFGDSYSGVATWLYEGVLLLPKRQAK